MKKKYYHFLRDESGSAVIWVAFCLIALFMLAAVLYNIHTLYGKYQAVQDEVSRCAAITLDSNLENAKLRDTITEMEYQRVLTAFEQNMIASGWTSESGNWVKYGDNRIVYRLSDVSIHVEGSGLRLSAILAIPLPWRLADQVLVQLPFKLYARILYIE